MYPRAMDKKVSFSILKHIPHIFFRLFWFSKVDMSINIDVVEEILLFQHVLDKKVSIQDFKVTILRRVYERYKMRKKSS